MNATTAASQLSQALRNLSNALDQLGRTLQASPPEWVIRDGQGRIWADDFPSQGSAEQFLARFFAGHGRPIPADLHPEPRR